MSISSQIWFRWAGKFMPRDRANWLAAMKIELEQIADPVERNAFAFGCFRVAMLEGARSRKGLSYIARVGGAALLFAFSSFAAIFWTAKVSSQPETLAFAKLITILCLCYMCGAALLMASLRGLKIYAAMGFSIATLSWVYCLVERPNYQHLSTDLLTAISFEAAGIMAGLFVAAIYLGWLYTPSIHDA